MAWTLFPGAEATGYFQPPLRGLGSMSPGGTIENSRAFQGRGIGKGNAILTAVRLSPKTVSFLRDLGHQAAHLHEQGLDRLSDWEILENAGHEGCIVLTHDLDFGDLLAVSGAPLPTVIIFRLRSMRPERVNLCLQTIITEHTQAPNAGAASRFPKRACGFAGFLCEGGGMREPARGSVVSPP